MSRAGYLFTFEGPDGALVVRDDPAGLVVEVSDRNRRCASTPVPDGWLAELGFSILRKAMGAGPTEHIAAIFPGREGCPAVTFEAGGSSIQARVG